MFRLRQRLRTSIWLVPPLCLVGFLALAVATLAIDRASDFSLIGQGLLGSPTAVQMILATGPRRTSPSQFPREITPL